MAEVARASLLPAAAMAGQAGVNVVQSPTVSVISASGGNGRPDVGLLDGQSFPSGFLGDGDASSTSVSGVDTVMAEVARASSLPAAAMAGQAGVNVVQSPTVSVISASGGNGRLDVGLLDGQSFPSGFLGDGDASDGAVASEQHWTFTLMQLPFPVLNRIMHS
jgi:hypothetical protein